jgi:hypothetical protein
MLNIARPFYTAQGDMYINNTQNALLRFHCKNVARTRHKVTLCIQCLHK